MTQHMINRYLDTNGDGTGTQQANGDYSVTPEDFKFTAVNVTELARVIVFIEDTSGFGADDYGDIAGGLTNGIEIKVYRNDSTVDDLLDGITIKNNAGWARVCHDVVNHAFGVGNDFLSVRWTWAKSGMPLKLLEGEELRFELSDDFSGLVEHTFMVEGTYRS